MNPLLKNLKTETSLYIPRNVLYHKHLDPTDKFSFAYFFERMDENGKASLSLQEVDLLLMHTKKITAVLRTLKKAHFINSYFISKGFVTIMINKEKVLCYG
ncbi:hypothetical protein KG091_00630 [Carnobacteriaceae bacterium zg-ZUI78]|nr:hypothetical protein [Carnobacteriaceae bacterium zg-ZUI78]